MCLLPALALPRYFFVAATNSTNKTNKADSAIEIIVNSRRRMHLCMQDDQNGQKMMVLTSAEETRLTCFLTKIA